MKKSAQTVFFVIFAIYTLTGMAFECFGQCGIIVGRR